MNSRVIAKEQLTAYQRWELAAFEEDSVNGGDLRPLPVDIAAEPAPPVEPEDADPTQVSLPTAEELERIQEDARREGYELGMQEGREAGQKTGREEGYKDGKKAAAEHVQRLANLIEAMDLERLRQDEAIAQELLNLALCLSRQMLRTSLSVKPELITAAIREAINQLPSLSGHLRLRINPAHAEDVREWLAGEHGHLHCKVVEDAHLECGSFHFESDHTELQADMATRWKDAVKSLGVDPAWLE